MSLLNTVTALTHSAVSTALKATLHPIDSTTGAVGRVKETAEAGVGLVRSRINAAPQQEQTQVDESVERESAHHRASAQDGIDEADEAADDVSRTAAGAATPSDQDDDPQASKKPEADTPAAATEKPTADPVDEDPRDRIPGPDVAPFIPPAIDDLPEPIVIVAE